MWILVTVAVLLLVLASASAIVQARKGRWWSAVAVFLPSLGVAALFGSSEWRSTSLLWLSVMFVAAGFGAEAMAYQKTRTPAKQQAGQ
ncbi:hypothetical protein [Streptomyces sp. NPDC002520]